MRLNSKLSMTIALIFVTAIFGMANVTASTTGGIINVTGDNHTYHDPYLVNVTKTTEGLPFLTNDVYSTLGVVVEGGRWSFNGKSWTVDFEAIGLSSSRAQNTKNSAYAIRSQTLRLKGTPNDRSWDILQGEAMNELRLGSWPHGNGDKASDVRPVVGLNAPLIQYTMNATGDSASFPLNASELNRSIVVGVDKYAMTGPEITKESREKTKEWTWYYSAWPWGDKADTAAAASWFVYLSPGETFEFDVICDTGLGLFDSSGSAVHVKVTAPPDPKGMNWSELKAHGITAHISRDILKIHSYDEVMNDSYVPDEQYILSYNIDDPAVEMA